MSRPTSKPSCPACKPQPFRTRCCLDELCAACHADFERWARDRLRDPVAHRAAFALWIRLNRAGGLR